MSEGRNRKLEAANALSNGYCCLPPHVHTEMGYDTEQFYKYESAQFITMRVLILMKGTVLMSGVLWIEQLLTMGLFGSVLLVFWKSKFMSEEAVEEFREEEGDIRNFCGTLSELAALLLAFLVSLRIGKWWNLRMNIQQMTQANAQLQLLISQFCTRDRDVMSSISRYIRAAMMMIFIKNRGYAHDLDVLVTRGVLTEEELEGLRAMKSHGVDMDKCLWTWIAQIIKKLLENGFITSDTLYQSILQTADSFVKGWYSIDTELNTQIPMKYVHLLGWVVKVHNLVVASLMGVVAGLCMFRGQKIMMVQACIRVFIMSFVYNAILIIDQELGNPFCGNNSGFAMEDFDHRIKNHMSVIVEAGDHLPAWMETWKPDEKTRIPQFTE